jgi:broad specificity phosphatase PhoE
MADPTRQSPFSGMDSTPTGHDEAMEPRPETTFDPGELAPHWASPYPNVLDDLSDAAQKELKRLCDIVGNKDIAARRWEVEQAWEARLFYRGYQYLLPRKGGGWVLPPFATSYNRSSSGLAGGRKFYGYETNMYTTYGEIVQAALTRDIPHVRFEPQDPESDADITAAHASTDYARVFGRSTDLKHEHEQIANYLWTDGRVMIITDHVKDSQRFGREDYEEENAAVPETESNERPVLFLVRHGETEKNLDGETRGRSKVEIDATGKREIARAAQWLKEQGVTRVISSPVPRALESGEELAGMLGVEAEADDRLSSLDIGTELTGKKSSDVHSEISEAFENPDQPIGGDGETPNDFAARVRDSLFAVLGAGQGIPAIVSHDSYIGEAFKILHGSDQRGSSIVEPGGVAAVYANADGTLRIEAVFPYQRPPASTGMMRGAPRGKELIEVGGKLEGKVPVDSMKMSEMPFVLFSKEYDIAQARGMFPDCADRIKPGSGAVGENQLDRIARINASLALEASYVTGDSMVRDCTIQRYWFRPSFFLECEKHEIKEELFEKFPDGVQVILAGGEAALVMARNESMDDHVTIVHASPGSGQNRMPLGGKMISLQKRGNNLVDLLNAFLIKTVPMKWLPTEIVDQEAIKDQGNEPGATAFYQQSEVVAQAGPGATFQSLLAVEPIPQPQAFIMQAIDMFFEKFGQMFSHALPSLFGSNANTDTVGGIAIQRDQALGCLGSPWHAIQVATCNYFRQAVQLAAQCRTRPIVGSVMGNKIRVELSELKGNILAYPEQDANFPETWAQKQSRWQMILTDANNPFVAKMMGRAKNQKKMIEGFGIEGVSAPESDAYDKQLGEFDILLRTGPMPNEKKIQLAQQLAQAVQNPEVDPAALQKAQQELQGMPDMVSSVPVDGQVDLNEAESEACGDWMNAPDGRKFKNGTEQQRAAFQNVRLHKLEHDVFIKQPVNIKPVSFSANLKDLPPDDAAQILQSEGIGSSGPEQVQSREFTALLKKSGKVGGGPVPGMTQ